MNRSDLIKTIADFLAVPKLDKIGVFVIDEHGNPVYEVNLIVAEKILDEILGAIGTSLENGKSVTITNFGRFDVHTRKPVTRINPRSGNEVKVPERKSILFHAAPALKKQVNDEP